MNLVNTQGRGVERLTTTGVVVDGVEYKADCVIFATGIAVSAGRSRIGQFAVPGRDGQLLSDKWAGGERSLHGIMTAGFPNLFMIGDIAQSAFTFAFSYLINEPAKHVSTIIRRCLDDRSVSLIGARRVTRS
ncbi:hypothetical protein [Streptomyces sp. NPDC096311]|uniref:hypothetical protein n=1 Tax=Streptomyces sp. NPDC096311 TaxID=3366083 RepID=UPI0038268998